MTGTSDVPAAPDAVWCALNDPAVLRACIAGCESLEPTGEHSYAMVLAAKVGPVAARFTGTMRLADIDPPRSYTLRFEGSGGVAGFAKGEGRVTLVPTGGDSTKLEYVATAQVGGKLAQIGSRLIDGVAHKMANDFFERFVASVSPPPVAAPLVAAADNPRAPTFRHWRGLGYAVIASLFVLLAIMLFRRGAP
ncbi:MAG: CoxG family protein [Gemmatimonadales bacterium]